MLVLQLCLVSTTRCCCLWPGLSYGKSPETPLYVASWFYPVSQYVVWKSHLGLDFDFTDAVVQCPAACAETSLAGLSILASVGLVRSTRSGSCLLDSAFFSMDFTVCTYMSASPFDFG